jgi:hypothetical protein
MKALEYVLDRIRIAGDFTVDEGSIAVENDDAVAILV